MRGLLWLGVLLVGCAPRVSGPSVTFSPLGAAEYTALITPFQTDLAAAGIQVTRASVFGYTGGDPEAFNVATRDFYARSPGFCPVQGGFLSASDRPVYLTLAVRGNEVRGFVYDQGQRPKLTFAYFEGQSRQALERQACPVR